MDTHQSTSKYPHTPPPIVIFFHSPSCFLDINDYGLAIPLIAIARRPTTQQNICGDMISVRP